MDLECIACDLRGFAQYLSWRFGTGSPAFDMLLLATLCLLVCVLLLKRNERMLKTSQVAGPERYPVAGRIEKLERSLSEFRTETFRSLEIMKAELQKMAALLGADKGGEDGIPAEAPLFEPEPDSQPEQAQEPGQDALQAAPAEVTPEKKTLEKPESLVSRLLRTRRSLFERLSSVFTPGKKLDEAQVAELQALLIGSDLGVKMAESLLADVRTELASGRILGQEDFLGRFREKITDILGRDSSAAELAAPRRRESGPTVVLVVGVNGSGKTTTAAKLAYRWKNGGAKVLLVAADTFRAAAVAQLAAWAERIAVPLVRGPEGCKPATVVFDAMQKAKDERFDAVIIDTAGRLHTKTSLMQELGGVRNVISRHQAGAPHETLLVIDGSTGQNAIMQAREFHEATPLSGLVVTKLDGTPRGGVVVAIKDELGVPVRFIGVGEGLEDLRQFNASEFVDALLQAPE